MQIQKCYQSKARGKRALPGALAILFILCALLASEAAAARKKVLFIAGHPSHSNGEHEFRAGCMLLAKAINDSGLDIEAVVHSYDWPKDESIFEGVDAVVIYADAGGPIARVEMLFSEILPGLDKLAEMERQGRASSITA